MVKMREMISEAEIEAKYMSGRKPQKWCPIKQSLTQTTDVMCTNETDPTSDEEEEHRFSHSEDSSDKVRSDTSSEQQQQNRRNARTAGEPISNGHLT